jgi:DNA-binding NarL/FixJ family response regulator
MPRATSCVQIALAAADSAARVRLFAALQSEPGFTVVGQASDEIGLMALRTQLQPDILLLDSTLAGLDMVRSWPAVRIVLLAGNIDEGHIIQALRLRARAIIPKTAPAHIVLQSIRSVLADEYWLGADSIAILVRMLRDLLPGNDIQSPHLQQELTVREQNIVAMIARGHSNKQISQELFISERTVKHHLTNIFGKLGLSSRLQLASFAAANCMVPNGERIGASLTPRSNWPGRGRRKPLSAVSLVS